MRGGYGIKDILLNFRYNSMTLYVIRKSELFNTESELVMRKEEELCMWTFFIALLTYLTSSAIIIALHIGGLITLKVAVIGHILVVTLILIVMISIVERSKRSLGSTVLKLKSTSVVVKVIFTCISIFFFLAEYKLIPPSINFLPWSAGLIMFALYLIWFSGRYIMDNGLVYDGTILRWEDIDSYEWKQGSSATTILFVRRKDKGILYKLRMRIHKEQKSTLDRILEQKICKQQN